VELTNYPALKTLMVMAEARDLIIVESSSLAKYGIFRSSDVELLGWIDHSEIENLASPADAIDYFANRFNELGDEMTPLYALRDEQVAVSAKRD